LIELDKIKQQNPYLDVDEITEKLRKEIISYATIPQRLIILDEDWEVESKTGKEKPKIKAK
jgi:hypothetical protein